MDLWIRGAELRAGTFLARAPDAITVGEVLRAVENLRVAGGKNNEDPFAGIWERVDAAMSDVLDGTSFGELAREWQQKNTKYVPNWEI